MELLEKIGMEQKTFQKEDWKRTKREGHIPRMIEERLTK